METPNPTQTRPLGPVIGIIIVIIVIIVAMIFFMNDFVAMPEEPVATSTPIATTSLGVATSSSSDELDAIEADLAGENLDDLDSEPENQ